MFCRIMFFSPVLLFCAWSDLQDHIKNSYIWVSESQLKLVWICWFIKPRVHGGIFGPSEIQELKQCWQISFCLSILLFLNSFYMHEDSCWQAQTDILVTNLSSQISAYSLSLSFSFSILLYNPRKKNVYLCLDYIMLSEPAADRVLGFSEWFSIDYVPGPKANQDYWKSDG